MRMKGVLMEYDYSSSNNIDTEGQASLIHIQRDSHLLTPNSWRNGRPNTLSKQKTTMMTYPRAIKSKFEFKNLTPILFLKKDFDEYKSYSGTLKGQSKNIIYMYICQNINR